MELAGAVSLLASWPVVAALLTGSAIGALVGVLPGLNGLTAIALLLPATIGLPQPVALAFLVSAYAAVSQGGSVTAIALGVPGEVPNAATVIDGLPLARAGRAGEAIGAALAASAVGGLIGGGLLIGGLLWFKSLALSFGSADMLAIAVGGVASVALLDRRPSRAVLAATFGGLLAAVGYSPVSGEPRLWFGWDVLLDGIPVVVLITGLYAMPELAAMIARRQATGAPALPVGRLRDGICMTLRRPRLLLRSAGIGVVVGLAPGAGAAVATFLAYAAAKRLDPDPASFGAGRIDGVIAPEAAGNAKEGAALLPTLVLGVPGSAAMSLLLAAFVLHGLPVGPEFLDRHLDLALALAVIMAAGNVISSVTLLPLAPVILRAMVSHGRLLGAVLLVGTLAGVYATRGRAIDLLLVFALGAGAEGMKRAGLPRAPLVVGFVLAPLIERYGHIAWQAHGPDLLTRPSVMAIAILLAAMALWPAVRRRISRRR